MLLSLSIVVRGATSYTTSDIVMSSNGSFSMIVAVALQLPSVVPCQRRGEGHLLSGDAHARRPLHKIHGVFFFFSFSTSVVGTSGFAPSATSGPLILPFLGKI